MEVVLPKATGSKQVGTAGMEFTRKDVEVFLKSSFDEKKLEKLDDEAGLWFLAYQTFSLALAIAQIESPVLQVNIGLLNFIVSGILFFFFEFTKYYELIDLRLAAYVTLRQYTFMLLSALIATFGWYLMYTALLPYLLSNELTWQALTFFLCMTASFVVFHRITRHYDRLFHASLQKKLNRDEDKVAVDIASKFEPTGIEFLILLFVFNVLVFLSTLSDSPFYATFLATFFRQPLIWSITLMLLFLYLYLHCREAASAQAKLMPEKDGKPQSNSGG